MMTLPTFLRAALSVAVICSASSALAFSGADLADVVVPSSAQVGADWSCTNGACDLLWVPSRTVDSSQSCVTDQKNFVVERIKNATSGDFAFEGQLVNDTPGVQTLNSFHSESVKRAYLKNMVFTVQAPAGVADMSLTITDAKGQELGQKVQDGSGKIVVFWGDNADLSHGADQTIQFEIRGSAVADAAGAETPRVWVHVAGKRCDAL